MTPETVIEPLDTFIPFLQNTPPREAPGHIANVFPDYTITHILGSGGSADIYRAERRDGRCVAIKIPHTSFDSTIDATVYRRFSEEAHLWKNLTHPNIVGFISSDDQPLPHIVMELMEGGSLRDLLKKRELSPGEAVCIMLQVLEGLSYAHKMATVHRDMKPENILFTSDGTAKITDWGIGKFMLSASLTRTARMAGTMFYSAPEQFDRKKFGNVDWQTDIFQTGIVFYEILTGMNPFADEDVASIMGNVLGFEPEPPGDVNPMVPHILDPVIMGALCKEKENRWSSADVMLFQLKGAISGEPAFLRKSSIPTVTGKSLSVKELALDMNGTLEAKVEEVKDLRIDLAPVSGIIEEVERHMRLGWYDEAIASIDEAMKCLHQLHMDEMREMSARRTKLRMDVKSLFKSVFARNIEAEYLFGSSLEAREAMEEGDLGREEELNVHLKEELMALLEAYRARTEKEMRIRELGSEVARIRKRARMYGIDPGNADEHVQFGLNLVGRGEFVVAREEYLKALDLLGKAIGVFEERERRDRKREYREMWYRSRKKVTITTVRYARKLLVHRKEKVGGILEERTNFLGMAFVKVPGRDYFIARNPVTQKVWRAVMGTKPWEARRYELSGDDHPAVYLSWYSCQEFIEKLNEMEGVDRYSLPSEEQWEHACRAGSKTAYCYGDDEKNLGEFAWFRDNAWSKGEKYAHPVGTKKTNAWGLYDMHGNVWEWCRDRYDGSGPARVIKGGSWDDFAGSCQCSGRQGSVPGDENDDLGLRPIRYE